MIRDSIEADGVLAIRDSHHKIRFPFFVANVRSHILRSCTQDEQDEACARQGVTNAVRVCVAMAAARGPAAPGCGGAVCKGPGHARLP